MYSICMCCKKRTKINDDICEYPSHGVCANPTCQQALLEWTELEDDNDITLEEYRKQMGKTRRLETVKAERSNT